jgi:hypothetical protein
MLIENQPGCFETRPKERQHWCPCWSLNAYHPHDVLISDGRMRSMILQLTCRGNDRRLAGDNKAKKWKAKLTNHDFDDGLLVARNINI